MQVQAGASLKKEQPYDLKKIIFGVLGLALMGYMWFLMPDIKGLELAGRKTMAVFALMICWWTGEVLSPVIVSLLGATLFTVLGIATITVAFSGFSNSTEIFLIFAFMLAAAVNKTGLGKRIAATLISKSNPSYKTVLFLVMFSGLVLAAIVPSGNARIVLLGTIALSLLNIFNQSPDKMSNIGRGFFVLLGVTSMITCDPFVTGGASSVLLVGLLAKSGITISYVDWFLNLFPPCFIVLTALWYITYKAFPPEVERLDQESYLKLKEKLASEVGQISTAEIKVAFITLFIVVFWMLGSYFNINATNVCMAGVILMYLPGIGVLKAKDIKELPWETLIFIACCLSLGQVISNSKLDLFLAEVISTFFVSESIFFLAFKLCITAMLIHFVIADALPIFAIFIPIVITTMQSIGVNPLVGVMFFQLGTTAYIMLYQQAQAITVSGFGQFEQRDFMKVSAFTYVLWLAMIPLMIFWWSFRGLI